MGTLQCFSVEGDEKPRKLSKLSDDPQEEEEGMQIDMVSLFPSQHQSNDQNHAPMAIEERDPRWLINQDVSIGVVLRLSRSEYGSIVSLNQSFRSLIQTGELYRLRRKMGIVEYWVYFSCNLLEWEVFDPMNGYWMKLPRMPSNQYDCFTFSDKESLAVGTELLVFGKAIEAPVVYGYSLLTHTWSHGTQMSVPRCLFASASRGEIAIVAGGCNPLGKILSVAEMYNSDTKTWEALPNMNKARKMSAGVFMDGKFYALGGMGEDGNKLTCGEEYDLETKEWRVIPNMLPPRTSERQDTTEAPPLVAVVNNVLYAADYAQRVLRRYVKERNKWVYIGSLPEITSSMNGWGLAFRACGDRIVVIAGESAHGGRVVEINSWIPDGGAPLWNLLARRHIGGSFVYNCAVMGC
ncbi:F-box/kelch-repeat protein SKIP11 [Glycine soja]